MRRRWLQRLGLQALALIVLALVATMAVGRIVLDSAGAGQSRRGSSGGDSGSGSGGASGSDRDASDPARRFASGAGDGSGIGSPVRASDSADAVARRAARPRPSTDGQRRAAPSGGVSVRVRFDPTPRLRTFLHQLDASLDRQETIGSLDKFLDRYGNDLTDGERLAPVQSFYEQVAGGAPMLEAVIETMRRHGPAGRDALDVVFDLKRDEYEAALQKYAALKQQGRPKDSKIYRYEQRIALVDELRGEINKSFRFE